MSTAKLHETKPAAEPDAGTLFISVIMPVRNEEPFIAGTLDALLAQEYPAERFEVLVVDGESTDGTREVVGKYVDRDNRVTLLSNPKRWSSAARNIGVKHARGDVVLIVDGHCEIPTKQMLANLTKSFETTGADCLGRPQPLDVTDATLIQQAIAAARSSWLGHHPDSFIYSDQPQQVPAASVAVAYRHTVFEQVGYFDEQFDACEDYEFNTRCDKAGLKCYFEPAIAVRYFPRTSLGGLFNQLTRYGRGRIRLARKHPQTVSIGSLIPALFLLGVVLGPVAALLWWPLGVVYFSVLGLYVATVLIVSAATALRLKSWRLVPKLPPVFGVIHAACGWGVLREVLVPRQDHLDKSDVKRGNLNASTTEIAK